MPDFDWAEFLELAEELVGRRGNPAAERTGISRAYYTAFHSAVSYFMAQGERLSLTGDDHQIVWNWFLGRTGQLERQVGANGNRLRMSRRKADYEPRFQGLSSQASTSLLEARTVIEGVRRLSDPRRA